MADDILINCRACGLLKSLGDFYKKGNGHYRQCKTCVLKKNAAYVASKSSAVNEYKKRWCAENAERIRAARKAQYERDSVLVKSRAAKYGQAHPERVRAYKQKWKQDNPQKLREYQFIRGNAKRVATPTWADRSAMLRIYLGARELTKATGVEHHVDHIVPLCSKLVSGLHCEANMQILEAGANISKLNRWWPDMWACESSTQSGQDRTQNKCSQIMNTEQT